MKRIGLIGSTGRVGQVLLKALLRDPEITVLAGCRDPDRRQPPDPGHVGQRYQVHKLNVFDEQKLLSFCRDVDLLINCAGPSGVLLDRVLVTAARLECPVLDPGGYDPVLSRLDALARQAGRHAAPIVVGAGLFPGLSGIYPRWLAESEDRVPDRLDVFYAGTDEWGPSSAWDIIHSTSDFGANRPPSYYDGGKLRAVPIYRAFRRVELPFPVGRVRGMLLYTEELGRIARQLGVSQVYCHGANNGRWSGCVLALVKTLGLNQRPEQIERSAQWLSWASRRDRRLGYVPCFAIDCHATWSDHKRHAMILTGDTYEGTAAVLLCAARLILSGSWLSPSHEGPPIGMAHELFDVARFMHVFRSSDCVIREDH